jgi:hypothetical protein
VSVEQGGSWGIHEVVGRGVGKETSLRVKLLVEIRVVLMCVCVWRERRCFGGKGVCLLSFSRGNYQ